MLNSTQQEYGWLELLIILLIENITYLQNTVDK